MTIDDYLDLVADALGCLDEFHGIGIIVDHQQDVETRQKELLAKGMGYMVMIGEVSNRIDQKNDDGPVINLKFGITVYSPKIITGKRRTGAQLRDVILSRIHLSKLQRSQHCYDEAYYVDGKIFEEKDGNKHRMIHATAFETRVTYKAHEDLEDNQPFNPNQ